MHFIYLFLYSTVFYATVCLSQNIKWENESDSSQIRNNTSINILNGKIKFDGSGAGEVIAKDSYGGVASPFEGKGDRKGGSKVNEVSSRQYSGHFTFNQPFHFSSSSFHFNDDFDFPQLLPSTQFSVDGGLKWSWERPWSSSPIRTTTKMPSVVHFPSDNSFSKDETVVSSQTASNSRRGSSSLGPKVDDGCECGVIQHEKESKKLQRIVGGTVAKENSWPWMVSISYMGQGKPFWFCGGSVISDKFVLTAAHCLKTMKNFGLYNVKLIMGTNNLLDSKAASYYSIRAVRAHPLYKSGTEDYDFALVETKERIKFTSKISPICIRKENDTYVNRTVRVAGWGTLQNGESAPSDLREVDLKIVSNKACQEEYYTNYRTPVTSSMICAWEKGKDSCQGDSGAPLFLKSRTSEPNQFIQIGVVSFGPPDCGVTKIPGVYSRVSSAIPWIKSIAKNGRFCKGSF